MYSVYGLYKTSLVLELGIKRLKDSGFSGDRLLVVVLDPCLPGRQRILDTMYASDGMSLVDGMAITGSIGMLMGVIYGSMVFIGPVALGLIGLAAGCGLGYFIDKMIVKGKASRGRSPSGDVLVGVRCRSEDEILQAEDIMKECKAVALGRSQGLF
ncbi:hypothetical protein DCCM_3129 [Desulfocucumis palustris]|uniref:DUF1269 domain-containing protein n=1 Tax=Desulfocucumis palustris TaxID=1898651 RepID=A0A2L2XCP9_9FIRM|nr:hypothetical protein [Desulfocucumis palustris]GBF34018.1 hypothetical protein DCCM_3129 [Desulfocucumis palustris]